MYDYVLIVHPTSEELLHKYEPGMKQKPRVLVKKVLEWMSPFRAAEVEGLHSNLGRTAKGALVMCPLLMEQMVTLSPLKVMRAVISAIEFAAKSLKPKLIGLTAYAAFPGNKGMDLTHVIGIPLTTGGNYTFAMIPESILRAVDLMEMELSKSQVLVLGATSSVGKYCVEILSHFVQAMYLTTHNQDKLNMFLATLPREKRSKLRYVRETASLAAKANIIIVATNRIPQDFDLMRVRPGAIIFDSSYPRKVSNQLRDDVLVIDGVSIRPPGKTQFNFDFGLPPGLCFPCMAEPMILALERKFENYSLGRDFDASRIREIIRLSGKHGFEIAGLTSCERVIIHEEILEIKRRSQLKRKRK